jgi:hypothetical protein
MELSKLENMVVPVEANGEILNLKDKKYGKTHFESSWYLNDKKMLLKGDSSWDRKKKLILCISLGKKPVKCIDINKLMFFLCFLSLKNNFNNILFGFQNLNILNLFYFNFDIINIYYFLFSIFYFHLTVVAYLEFHSTKKISSIVSALHKEKTFIISCGCTYNVELSIHEILSQVKKETMGKVNFKYFNLFLCFCGVF